MKVVCVGYGSFELAVRDICDALGYEYLGRLLHPWDASGDVEMFPLGSTPLMVEASMAAIMACCRTPLTLVSPLAQVSRRAEVGQGVLIEPFVGIAGKAAVRGGAVLQTHCSIAHDCEIGNFANLAPGCLLAGGVKVGARAVLGTGVVVVPNRSIGPGAKVWAGAVVQQDVSPGSTHYARQLPQPFSQRSTPEPALDPRVALDPDLVAL